ncbi:MAG: SufE family protein [Verrucomicrobiales bacterium]
MPPALEEIVLLFENLPEGERRGLLVHYAESARHCAPLPSETFDLEDVRKDEECTDTVGIHLRVDAQNHVFFRVSLGHEVQTLTRAMTAILCKGLNESSPEEVLALEADFVPRLIGADLVRQRSQTVYYVLGRMKGALTVWRNRRRALNPNPAPH